MSHEVALKVLPFRECQCVCVCVCEMEDGALGSWCYMFLVLTSLGTGARYNASRGNKRIQGQGPRG